MYHKHHTRGIVVSSKTEGSDSRRVNILTEHFGLINAKVQGSRNISSRLRGSSQDFSLGEFSLVHGKSGWKIVSARLDKNLFELFRNHSSKLKIVSNILNLIKKLIAEETHSPLFSIISNFFNFLITAREEDIALAECLTLVRILHVLGYMRYDPEFTIPVSSSEIKIKDLKTIAPKRSKIVFLINESLKAT